MEISLSKKLTVIFLFVSIIISVIFLYTFLKTYISNTTKEPVKKELSQNEQVVQVNRKSKINIPTISSSSQIGSLPKDISLVIPEAKNLIIRSVKFSDGKSGYVVYYDVDYSLVGAWRSQTATFLTVEQKKNWNLLVGLTSETYDLVEEEGSVYKVKMQFYKNTDSLTNVVMTFIEK